MYPRSFAPIEMMHLEYLIPKPFMPLADSRTLLFATREMLAAILVFLMFTQR